MRSKPEFKIFLYAGMVFLLVGIIKTPINMAQRRKRLGMERSSKTFQPVQQGVRPNQAALRFCPMCGARVHPYHRFCQNCGSAL